MDITYLTQVGVIATAALVFGRIGWAVARLIDRRAARPADLPGDAAERLRTLEEEHLVLRQELAELQERQDFTERTLLREPGGGRPASPGAPSERVVTPR